MLAARLSLICLAYSLVATVYAQSASQDRGLYTLMTDPAAASRVMDGAQGMYVKNKALELPPEVVYTHIDFVDGTAYTTDAREVPIRARYHYNSGTIQIEDQGKVVQLKGSYLPLVTIGRMNYRFEENLEGTTGGARYARLLSASDDFTYRAAQTYFIVEPSDRQPQRGIVPQKEERVTLDSTVYLIGLRDLPVRMPKRAKRLRAELRPCQLPALERSLAERRRYGSLEQIESFMKALGETCQD